MEQPVPATLLEAVATFSNKQVAHDFFVALRWPNGIACPRYGCGSADVSAIGGRSAWRCRECKMHFTAKVGTVFEDSPIGFDKWLPAMWLLSSCRNGVSSCELARHLKVTQKTAWFMLHRLRLAMRTETFEKLSGMVEVDETYIGGKMRNKPKRVRQALHGDSVDNKTPVLGMIERGGRVSALMLPDPKARFNTVYPIMQRTISHEATIVTDSAHLYKNMIEYFNAHLSVNHSADEYVRGSAHTNTIECFWSILKRTLGGTYIATRPWHLDRYLDEQMFRFNERKNTDGPRFAAALRGADGRRLTYAGLTLR